MMPIDALRAFSKARTPGEWLGVCHMLDRKVGYFALLPIMTIRQVRRLRELALAFAWDAAERWTR